MSYLFITIFSFWYSIHIHTYINTALLYLNSSPALIFALKSALVHVHSHLHSANSYLWNPAGPEVPQPQASLFSERERQTSSVWAWAVWHSIHAELIQFNRREQAGETEKFLLSPSRTSQLRLTVSAFVFPKNRLTTTGLLCSTKLHRKCPALITTKACFSARPFI